MNYYRNRLIARRLETAEESLEVLRRARGQATYLLNTNAEFDRHLSLVLLPDAAR